MDCKNCKTELTQESDYCNSCGGRVVRNRLTFKNLFEHITETFFNFDNKLLRTFIKLSKRPDEVIIGYIKGIRRRFVNPISYFAIALTLAGLQIYIIKKFGADFEIATTDNALIAKKQLEYNNTIFEFISEYQSLVMMLYIPIYALMAKLLWYKNKTYNYTELLVVFIYTQAHYSIVVGILTIILVPLGLSMTLLGFILIPIQIGYFAYVLKRIYAMDLGQILLKTLIFLLIIGFIFVLLSIGAGILMYKSGFFNDVIEAERATRAVKDSIN